jgi:hypothetical protein
MSTAMKQVKKQKKVKRKKKRKRQGCIFGKNVRVVLLTMLAELRNIYLTISKNLAKYIVLQGF